MSEVRATSNRPTGRTPGAGTGFTLIELLVVIAVIGLLVGIVLPSFHAAKQQARAVATQAKIMGLDAAAEIYYQEQKLYPGQDRDSMLQMAGMLAGRPRRTGTEIMIQRLFGFDDNFQPLPASSRRLYAEYSEDDLAVVPDVNNPGTNVHAFVDKFADSKMPLLYYPAHLGRTAANEIYIEDDNLAYLQKIPPVNAGDPPLTIGPGTSLGNVVTSQTTPSVIYRPKSFIIIGAGLDRLYFTGDDNVNFNR